MVNTNCKVLTALFFSVVNNGMYTIVMQFDFCKYIKLFFDLCRIVTSSLAQLLRYIAIFEV